MPFTASTNAISTRSTAEATHDLAGHHCLMRDIKDMYSGSYGIIPSYPTMTFLSRLSCLAHFRLSRWLKSEGIQHFKAIRRPKLTPELAKKRLIFARQYLEKPLSWWRKVIFSDETTIVRGGGDVPQRVWYSKVGLTSRSINSTTKDSIDTATGF
jgi:hypothetical protein